MLYVIVYTTGFQLTYNVTTASQLFKFVHANPFAAYDVVA
jgi:hypothetical protein